VADPITDADVRTDAEAAVDPSLAAKLTTAARALSLGCALATPDATIVSQSEVRVRVAPTPGRTGAAKGCRRNAGCESQRGDRKRLGSLDELLGGGAQPGAWHLNQRRIEGKAQSRPLRWRHRGAIRAHVDRSGWALTV
jgi:hypothetical protein